MGLRRRDGAELLGVALLAGLLSVGFGAPLAVSIAVSPEAIERGAVVLTPPCPTRERTGEPCATCGLTRGFCAMSRLRVGDAAGYHPAAPWLYAGFWLVTLASGALLVAVAREAWRRRPWVGAMTLAREGARGRSR